MASKKQIAVIGGGVAGIGSIVMLKEEGLNPVCFEQTDKPGGTWNYREVSNMEGVASIMPTTIINHSKEMGAISNFPPKKEYNNYMRHNEMYQYVKDFASEHDCFKYIQFNMMVTCVKRSKDYDETGCWVVTAKNTITGEELTDIYDGVMVCVGHVNRPIMPNYPNQESFKGKIKHTHTLKEVDEYKNQNVLVVGMGCSALDAAVGASDVAKQVTLFEFSKACKNQVSKGSLRRRRTKLAYTFFTDAKKRENPLSNDFPMDSKGGRLPVHSILRQVYLSTRTGAYVLNRVGPQGYPMDYFFMRRYLYKMMDIFPLQVCNWYMEKFYIDNRFHHKLYNVPPKYHFFNKDPVINDHFGSKLLSGSIIQKRDIARFTEKGVFFKGSSEETEIDAVIMATGYTWKFPFLEEGIVTQEKDGRINLYKGMYPPQLKHPTLAIIGFLLTFGPGFPTGELQCRWAAHLLAGEGHLPSSRKMLKDIERTHRANVKRYSPSDKMTLRVDCLQYMDDIASKFGVMPNLPKLFFTDIRLFWKIYWGPFLSYQYRLQGPHKWEGAREAIMTSKQRMLYPLRRDGFK